MTTEVDFVIDILKKFSDVWGISGYEDNVREEIKQEIMPYVNEIKVDKVGNLIGLQRGEGKGSLMIATHMDELGFLTTMVEDGYLRFTTVGGFDLRILPGQEVVVHAYQDIEGVIGGGIMAIAGAFIYRYLYATYLSTFDCIALGGLAAILAPLGDLTESMFKRDVKIYR